MDRLSCHGADRLGGVLWEAVEQGTEDCPSPEEMDATLHSVSQSNRRSASNQERARAMKKMTTAFDAPVTDNHNIQTAGKPGPAVLQDVWFLEKMPTSVTR
jgi:hypothetical protein